MIIDGIMKELRDANAKFPGYPHDPVYGACVMGEEAGEVLKAALDYAYNRGSRSHLIKEINQTAAMCIRFLRALHGAEMDEMPEDFLK